MANVGIPSTYNLLNSQSSKNPILVVVIEGIPYLFTTRTLETVLVYGAANVTYGEDGIIYGGLIPYGSFKNFISLEGSNLVLQQRLEPEQGKASVSTLTIAFIDADDSYMTKVVSPGVIIQDIIMSEIGVYLGFQNTSFPTDFFRIFRGYCSSVTDSPGLVNLQISDANLKLRANLFFIAQSLVKFAIGSSDEVFSLNGNENFFGQIQQPDGSTYSKSVRTYVKIDDEIIECIPVRQENFQYVRLIQGVLFTANLGHGTDVSLIYIVGATAGNEVVTVSDSVITIQIESGVSTAQNIFEAILQKESASNLVIPQVYSAITTQVVMSQSFLFTYTVTIQGIIYISTTGHGTDISISYQDGGVAGSEVVTVSFGTITVKIQSGVSTAAQVATAIGASGPASALVTTAVINGALVQVPQIQTFLTTSNGYSILVKNGIKYISQPGITNAALLYANDGTVGSETVSVVGSVITVHMQSGASTAQSIFEALVLYSSIVFPIVQFELLPHCESNLQSSFTSTPLVAGQPATQFAVIQRGARGTVAATHEVSAAAASSIQIGDPIFTENAMIMALKVMLSGWGRAWKSGVPVSSIGLIPDPAGSTMNTQAIQMPAGIDVVDLYNLSPGDFCYLYGSDTKSNNATPLTIVRFASSAGTPNNVIYVSQTLTKDDVSTSMTISFRSQFDCYPLDAGMILRPTDVDIDHHLYVLQTFLGTGVGNLIFFINSTQDSGKDFIQTEIYFPIGAYGLTRYGQISVGYNAPPIANQNIVILNENNILNPEEIKPIRSVNSRQFFNDVTFSYGADNDGNFTKVFAFGSSKSISRYGGYASSLPIQSLGIPADYPQSSLEKVANYFLLKYQFCATTFSITINWQAGSTTEVGDIALIDDSNNVLQIANFDDGTRKIGKQLYNIIDRTFDFVNGKVKLIVQNNVGANAGDRFATISPSSIVGEGSSNTSIVITDSFGIIFPGDEGEKWRPYVGLTVLVHSDDYVTSAIVTLTSVDPLNNYLLKVTDMGFTPTAGYVVDVAPYPTSSNPNVNALYKIMHDFLSPTVEVVSASDQLNFVVDMADIAKFLIGATVMIHDLTFSFISNEVIVTSVDTGSNTVTVGSPLGFTPVAGQFVDLIGFADGGSAYRLF